MKRVYKKIGSATLMVVMFATVFILYASSTYSDVRHMKNRYEEYERNIVQEFEKEYEEMVEHI